MTRSDFLLDLRHQMSESRVQRLYADFRFALERTDQAALKAWGVRAGTRIVFLALLDFSSGMFDRLPHDHAPLWDRMAKIGRPFSESLSIGLSAGLAYHACLRHSGFHAGKCYHSGHKSEENGKSCEHPFQVTEKKQEKHPPLI